MTRPPSKINIRHVRNVDGAVLPFSVRRPKGGRWATFDATGEQIGGAFAHEVDALDMCERLEMAARMKKRKCLCCETIFWSEGPHHRTCGCLSEAGASMDEVYSVAR